MELNIRAHYLGLGDPKGFSECVQVDELDKNYVFQLTGEGDSISIVLTGFTENDLAIRTKEPAEIDIRHLFSRRTSDVKEFSYVSAHKWSPGRRPFAPRLWRFTVDET